MDKLLARSRHIAIFLCGGVLSAAIDIGTMQLLLHGGLHLAAATTAGFLSGLLVNYAWHSRVTFDAAATPASFARYLCVVAINYSLTLGCVALAQALAGMPLAGKILSLPVVAVNSYLLGKFWIFK
jgi:putative flippase GtrA